jgi:hypothetical protein
MVKCPGHTKLSARERDPLNGGKHGYVILRPTRTSVTIERTFKNMSTTDELWGFFLVAQLQRLDCQNNNFWLRVSVIQSLKDCQYVHLERWADQEAKTTWTKTLFTVSVEELLPIPNAVQRYVWDLFACRSVI